MRLNKEMKPKQNYMLNIKKKKIGTLSRGAIVK